MFKNILAVVGAGYLIHLAVKHAPNVLADYEDLKRFRAAEAANNNGNK